MGTSWKHVLCCYYTDLDIVPGNPIDTQLQLHKWEFENWVYEIENLQNVKTRHVKTPDAQANTKLCL